MKRLRMKTLYAGPTRSVAPDQVADFDDDEAHALVSGGYAVYVDDDPAAAPAEFKAAKAAEADTEEPPAGSMADVLAWVGDDPARAARALDAERAKGDAARKTLIGDLEKIGAS